MVDAIRKILKMNEEYDLHAGGFEFNHITL